MREHKTTPNYLLLKVPDGPGDLVVTFDDEWEADSFQMDLENRGLGDAQAVVITELGSIEMFDRYPEVLFTALEALEYLLDA